MKESGVRRVCLVVTTLDQGGAQETVLALAKGLARDVQVAVFAGREQDCTMVEAFRQVGIPVVTIASLVRTVSPWRDLLATVQLALHLRRLRPDVVHTHSSKAGVVGRLAARVSGVAVVVHTVHGWSFHAGMRIVESAAYRFLERLLARISDTVVVVSSQDLQAGLRADIGRQEKYVLIRSGIDLAAFRSGGAEEDRALVREDLGLAKEARVVGCVGRLCQQKDPITFLRAAKEIGARVEDASFLLVGEGPLRPVIEVEAQRLGLEDRLVMTGWRRDMPRVLRALDVLVVSSRWEGLPRVIVEAMACGVAVVATRVNGVVEVVEDDRTGLLSESGDVDALATATCRVLGDPELADRLRTGSKDQLEEFGQEKMVEQTCRLYARLLRERSAS